MTRAWMLVGMVACACEAGAGQEADCESDADVPLLPLDVDEAATLAGRTDDAWIFQVTTYPEAYATLIARQEQWPAPVAKRIVAVEGCDAVPRTIADGLEQVHAPPRVGLPWIAASEAIVGTSSALWRIDPEGDDAPVQLTGRYSSVVWTDDGALVVDTDDGNGGTLVRVRETEDGVTTTIEREGVLQIARSVVGDLVLDRVALVTIEGDLVVRDLASGEERLVRPGVGSAEALDAHSRILRLSTAIEERDVVVDVDGGAAIEFAPDDGRLVFRSSSIGSAEARFFDGEGISDTQIVLLPELRELQFAGDWWCADCSRTETESALLAGPDGLFWLAPGGEVPVRVRAGATIGGIADGHLYALEPASPTVGASYGPGARLVRMDLDGSQPVDLLRGDAAMDVVRLSADRWAYTHDVGADGLGELVVVDTATAAREAVADDVWQRGFSSFTFDYDEPMDDITYFAVSDDPARHGMRLVHVDRLFE
jgi:hypothetical protein